VANEIQQFEFSEPLAAGSFTLTLGAETTAAIDWDATSAEIVSALEALTGIGAGNVQVNGWDGTTLVVEFIAAKANANIAQMTCDATSAAYDTGDVTVDITVNGVTGVQEVQTLTPSATPDGGTWTINGVTVASGEAALNTDVEAAIEDDAGANLECSVAGDIATAFVVTFDAEAPVALLEIDSTALYRLTTGSTGINNTTVVPGDALTDERQRISCDFTPSAGGFRVTWNGETTGTIAWNAVAADLQAALEALPNIGVGNVATSGVGDGTLTNTQPWDIVFIGALSQQDVAEATLEEDDLESDTVQTFDITFDVDETTAGVTPVQQQETITIPASTTGGTYTLSDDAGSTNTTAIDWDETAANIEANIESTLSLQCGVTGSGPYVVTRDTAAPHAVMTATASDVTGDVTCEESTTQEGAGVGSARSPFVSPIFRSKAFVA